MRERERERGERERKRKRERLNSYMWGFVCMAKRNKEAMTSSPVFILADLYPQFSCIYEGSYQEQIFRPIVGHEILRRNRHLAIM